MRDLRYFSVFLIEVLLPDYLHLCGDVVYLEFKFFCLDGKYLQLFLSLIQLLSSLFESRLVLFELVLLIFGRHFDEYLFQLVYHLLLLLYLLFLIVAFFCLFAQSLLQFHDFED